jgi:hypothetical protein
MEKLRAHKETKIFMLGLKLQSLGYTEFRYMLPPDALTLATEEALERGLLTKI